MKLRSLDRSGNLPSPSFAGQRSNESPRKFSTSVGAEGGDSAPAQGGAEVDSVPRLAATGKMSIEVARSDRAESLLNDYRFRSAWISVGNQCPWGTAFQTHAFAAAWYQEYRSQFEPLLVVGHDDVGTPVGIIPLAICRKSGRLLPAGTHQAEYQGWICIPGVADSFAAQAFTAIRQRFPSSELTFRYLPAGTPLGWSATGDISRKCLLKNVRRPLMQLGDGSDVRQSLQKSGNKSRLRQLKKLGPVSFERVTDPEQFESILNRAALCHDCRQLAIHGVAPFLEDDHKRAFHLAMMNAPGLLHATVLKVGNEIASFHLNVTRGRELQLYLIAHDPRFSRFSPGKLHVLYLARMLQEEGFERIDLTPGGDGYKERFANDADEVQRLSLYPTAAHRLKGVLAHKLEDVGRRLLERSGFTPADVRCLLRDCGTRRVIARTAGRARELAQWFSSRQVTRIYSGQLAADLPNSNEICRDNLDHLIAQCQTATNSPRAFISQAMRRFEEGQYAYTRMQQGRVVTYGWLVNDASCDESSAVPLPGAYPLAESALIQDFRVAVDDQEQMGLAALRIMIGDVLQAGAKQVYIIVRGEDARTNRLLQEAGFKCAGVTVRHTRLGRSSVRLEEVLKALSSGEPTQSIGQPAVEHASAFGSSGVPRVEHCRKTG